MQQNNQWFYWNDLPNNIPVDISNLNDEQKTEFLKKWNKAVWTRNSQSIEQKLSNIKNLVAIKIAVPEWVMDRLKEAADHYVNGFWLSAIALTESICEFLTYYFLEEYVIKNGIDNLIEHNKKLQSQYQRLRLLKKLTVLSEQEWKLLDEIRDIRNKYIHLNKIDFNGNQIKEDSLKSLKNLITFLNDKAEQLKQNGN